MTARAHRLREQELGWALAVVLSATILLILSTGWLRMDAITAARATVLFALGWLLADVLLPSRAGRIARCLIAALAGPFAFVCFGGLANPASLLVTMTLSVLLLLTYQGWLRWVSTTLVWAASALVMLAADAEVRFAVPDLAQATHWLWGQPWLNPTQVVDAEAGGRTLLYLAVFAVQLAVLSRVFSRVLPSDPLVARQVRALEMILADRCAAALIDSRDRIISCTESFARITGGRHGTDLPDVLTLAPADSIAADGDDGNADPLARTQCGSLVRYIVEPYDDDRRLLTLRPFGPAELSACGLTAAPVGWITCWPDGEVLYHNPAASALIPTLRRGMALAQLLSDRTEPGPSLEESLLHPVSGTRRHDGVRLRVRSEPVYLAGFHTFTYFWIDRDA